MDGYTAAVITVSDSAYLGKRQDTAGPAARSLLEKAGFVVKHTVVVADDRDQITHWLRQLCGPMRVDVVVTTGGTGIGPRDVTPEATLAVVERLLPGLPEAMRLEGLKQTPFAMASRQVAGVCGSTVIVNLPGSTRAVEQGLNVVLPVLKHLADLLAGNTEHPPAFG
ncbi:MAG: MogA/MoaB family molybdenum cofactor biosynthesis protein [Alicyclobacillaceae bacterium]|nr:MogA/MoaB family molybdenum cofactor biosynthesis protein [Alicyclobacillaceae bacterium]